MRCNCVVNTIETQLTLTLSSHCLHLLPRSIKPIPCCFSWLHGDTENQPTTGMSREFVACPLGEEWGDSKRKGVETHAQVVVWPRRRSKDEMRWEEKVIDGSARMKEDMTDCRRSKPYVSCPPVLRKPFSWSAQPWLCDVHRKAVQEMSSLYCLSLPVARIGLVQIGSLDLHGVIVPRRVVSKYVCIWHMNDPFLPSKTQEDYSTLHLVPPYVVHRHLTPYKYKRCLAS